MSAPEANPTPKGDLTGRLMEGPRLFNGDDNFFVFCVVLSFEEDASYVWIS